MKKYILSLICLLPLLLGSCDDFLDINTDPNQPTNMTIDKLLPTAQLTTAYAFAPGSKGYYGGIGQTLSVYMHQVTVRESADKYGSTGSDWYITTSWRVSYTEALSTLDDIILQGVADGNLQYAGIAKILKAYIYSELVDVYGDVPYNEANLEMFPHFDAGSDIYISLFGLIDDAISNLTDQNATNNLVPGTDDIIYGGDISKWLRAARTLKLKMLNQVRLVQDVKADVQNLLSQDLISSFSESLMYKFGKSISPDDRHPAYVDTYEATQKTNYMSPWLYEILEGYNPIFGGAKDPRIAYYFYNQTALDEDTENDTEYRDGGFISIYFGSDGPDKGASQDKYVTVYGIYPVGGLYDDGSATKVSGTSSTGTAPFRMMTYADRLFIEAELIQANVIAGNVAAKLNDAMKAAFAQVDGVVKLVANTQTVPEIVSLEATATYMQRVMDAFSAGDDNKKMEIIMTQKWLSSFGNSVDQYTDYRRTGYPVLFDPNNASMAPDGYATPANGNGGDPMREDEVSPPVPVSCSRNYPVSLPWSSTELEKNPNAPDQKTDPSASTYKVFWDN